MPPRRRGEKPKHGANVSEERPFRLRLIERTVSHRCSRSPQTLLRVSSPLLNLGSSLFSMGAQSSLVLARCRAARLKPARSDGALEEPRGIELRISGSAAKVEQASCLPPSPKQARCLLLFPPFLPGNTLKIQPPLSPNQTSRKFQEVLSDPAVGELKRRVECTQSAPAKAKGWREKRAHPVKGAKSLNLLLLRIPFRRTATPPQKSQTPLRDRIALHGLERGGGIEVRLRRSGCRSSSRLGSADKACLGRRPRRPRRLSLV